MGRFKSSPKLVSFIKNRMLFARLEKFAQTNMAAQICAPGSQGNGRHIASINHSIFSLLDESVMENNGDQLMGKVHFVGSFGRKSFKL